LTIGRRGPEVILVAPTQLHSLDADHSGDGLLDAPAPAAARLAEQVATVFGAASLAVIHYGSRAQGRARRADSAFDYFVIVTGYLEAYRAAGSLPGLRCRPRVAALLARVLPPNSMAVHRSGPFGEREAKCLLLSARDFDRECSARARDHFVQTRLAQRVVLAWARDTESASAVLGCVRAARERSFQWVRAFLPPRFDLPGYCLALIQVPFAHEIRAEPKDHPEVLFEAQRAMLLGIYAPVLARLVARGTLAPEGDHYRQRHPPGPIARLRLRAYFRRSRLRTTLRLLKQPFLYDGWLEYLLRKIDRSTGERFDLTERERSRPLIFLWPRVLRYLRSRPQRER
jgi:hypothetical protein